MQKKQNKTSAKKLATNQRYIDEKTDKIQANLPRGYADKLNKLAESAGVSKAQVLKNCIDTAYNALFDE